MAKTIASIAIVLVVMAIIFIERKQRGTDNHVYGKGANPATPKKRSPRRQARRAAAVILSLILPGTGHLYRGELYRGVGFTFAGTFCWLSIAIALANGIPALGTFFAALLVGLTLTAVFQAAAVQR